MCFTAPKNEDIEDVIIFVPAAILGSIPKSSMIGRRIVPSAKPTNPPSIPTQKEMNVSTNATNIEISDVNVREIVNELTLIHSFITPTDFRYLYLMVPKVRVELTCPLGQRFLRPPRLPFRHFGLSFIICDIK